METKFKKLSSNEKKLVVQKIVTHCRELAVAHISEWKPQDKKWPVIEGCAYLRLSTDDQCTVEKGSLEQQVNIAIAETVARSQADKVNYRIVRFYIEAGVTGRKESRPEFDIMRREIERRKYRFVVFKELARIARETTIWKSFFKLCQSRECEIFIRNFPLNPNDPADLLRLDILAAFAEYESNQTSRRLKENIFSAMLSSGKFNSTHKVLGLDQLEANGKPQVGFYVKNPEEMKTVEWIMRAFLKYGSYQRVLEECEKHGVTNKDGRPFLRHSLITLLTNTKYIGKWEVNAENKDKLEGKLMPYDRYAEIELPHGCVIDSDLWNEVQRVVARIAGNKDKNTQIKRTYFLTGLLKLSDGTIFHGTGAWSKGGSRVNYYYNKKHNIRLPADAVEEKAKEVVQQLIHDTPELREAIRRQAANIKTASELLDGEAEKVKGALAQLDADKRAATRRLDFFLSTDNGVGGKDATTYRSDYDAEMERIHAEAERLGRALEKLGRQKRDLETASLDWKDLGKNAKRVQDLIQETDCVALKNAFRELFDSIQVGDLDQRGVRKLEFVLKDGISPADVVTAEENSSVALKMG